MKKNILSILFIFFYLISGLSAQEDPTGNGIFLYIPDEEEIQVYMNFYARLNALDAGKYDANEIKDYYDTFLKDPKYRKTYQSLLLEAYLLNTNNRKVQKIISRYIQEKNYSDNFSVGLLRLYSSKEEKTGSKTGTQIRHNFQNQFYDENINLFTMSEQYTFDNKLGLMLFQNDYDVFQVDLGDKVQGEKPQNQKNTDSFYAVYGGGSNSLRISFTRKTSVDEKEFNSTFLYKDFYKKKFEDFEVEELPPEGILKRAGASKIYIGVGHGKDQFPGVENFSAVIFLYSKNDKTAYRVDFFMNMTENNNNYSFRNRIYNHLVFQSLLTFINE